MNSFHQSEKKNTFMGPRERAKTLLLSFFFFFSPPLEISSNEFPNAEVKEIDGWKCGLFQIKSMKKKEWKRRKRDAST